jgi:hypothetical protein
MLRAAVSKEFGKLTPNIRAAGTWSGALLLVMMAIISSPAAAEKRVALVIGNSAYVKAVALPNPKNDALAIAVLLGKTGFDVVDVNTDLGAEAMRRALRDFSEQVRDADVAVVFYGARHGDERRQLPDPRRCYACTRR